MREKKSLMGFTAASGFYNTKVKNTTGFIIYFLMPQ